MFWLALRMRSLGIAAKIALFLLLICVASVICVLSLPIVFESCKGIDDCDPFLPVCAAHINEHQFFYSQCDMLREICLTGKDWKTDHLSHCNVWKL